jgi:hypothetical protein
MKFGHLTDAIRVSSYPEHVCRSFIHCHIFVMAFIAFFLKGNHKRITFKHYFINLYINLGSVDSSNLLYGIHPATFARIENSSILPPIIEDTSIYHSAKIHRHIDMPSGTDIVIGTIHRRKNIVIGD